MLLLSVGVCEAPLGAGLQNGSWADWRAASPVLHVLLFAHSPYHSPKGFMIVTLDVKTPGF